MSTDLALGKLAARGTEIGSVIDVGASNGMWSAVCERHFPKASYLLIEAQDYHRQALGDYCEARTNAEYVLAAAGAEQGEIWFDDSSPWGGLAMTTRTESVRTRVPMTTLDNEARTRNLPGPYLVKLDTHGFEVPILEGSLAHVLPAASILVIECYNFRIAPESLLFHEMIEWLHKKGFGVIDMCEPLWREHDHALWQMDLVFIPLSNPAFSHTTYL
jgi:FkbM family methyltransferase